MFRYAELVLAFTILIREFESEALCSCLDGSRTAEERRNLHSLVAPGLYLQAISFFLWRRLMVVNLRAPMGSGLVCSVNA